MRNWIIYEDGQTTQVRAKGVTALCRHFCTWRARRGPQVSVLVEHPSVAAVLRGYAQPLLRCCVGVPSHCSTK